MQVVLRIARTLADETRLRILGILLEGETTVSDLVTRLDLDQPRVSTHLGLLRKAGLVEMQSVGRQRIYRVDAVRVRVALEALGALGSEEPGRLASAQALREIQHNTPLRLGRTCYDHLAGIAGVQLLDELLRRGWLQACPAAEGERRPRYQLTPSGEHALVERGVNVSAARRARRAFACECLDWTERRPHLGGALGAAIAHTLEESGIVNRERASRVVHFRNPIHHWLEIPDLAGRGADERSGV